MPRSLAPGVARLIDGQLSARDSHTGGDVTVEFDLTRRDDGSAELELTHYTEVRDALRRLPIGASTFAALADALFEPTGEGSAIASPVALEGTVVSSIDAGASFCHAIREEVGAAGRVTLTVAGIGAGRTETLTEHEPAVAAYLAGKVEMMRRIAYDRETDAPDQDDAEPGLRRATVPAGRRDEATSAAKGIEVPWNPSAVEADEVELPSLWLSVRAVIGGDGDAPALANLAAIPTESGPVKLAVVPTDSGGNVVHTLDMPRETYLALAAALAASAEGWEAT